MTEGQENALGENPPTVRPKGEAADTAELVIVAFAALALTDRLYARLMNMTQRGERLDPAAIEFARNQASHAKAQLERLVRSFAEGSAALDDVLGDYAATWLAGTQTAGTA